MRVQVVPRDRDDEALKAEIAGFDIGSHGLVGLRPDGTAKAKLPGHNFGEAEIQGVVDLLRAGS